MSRDLEKISVSDWISYLTHIIRSYQTIAIIFFTVAISLLAVSVAIITFGENTATVIGR